MRVAGTNIAPNISANVINGMGISTFFPVCLSLLLATTSVDTSVARFGVVSLGVAIGMIPIEVIPEFFYMACGARYHMGIMRDMFDNVRVFMTR